MPDKKLFVRFKIGLYAAQNLVAVFADGKPKERLANFTIQEAGRALLTHRELLAAAETYLDMTAPAHHKLKDHEIVSYDRLRSAISAARAIT